MTPPSTSSSEPRDLAADLTTLALGATHDVRNLLLIATAHGHSLLQSVGSDSPLRADVEAILEAAERASTLTRHVLAAGRPPARGSVSCDLNSVVRGCDTLVRRLCGEGIAVEIRLAPAVWPVGLPSTPLEQVVINLVMNAREAMNGRGRLRIATEASVEREVRLTVEDTGHGMDQVVQERMFEPFFTTRHESGGTGIGMATVRAIVSAAGGCVRVRSGVGDGTRITIVLPALGLARADRPVPVVAAGAGVLVVDDERGICELLGHYLRRRGYRTVTATSAGEAEAAWAAAPERFDLVVSDVSLPDVQGPSLAARFRKERERLALLFISGSLDAADRIAECGLRAPVLTKPFSMDEFVSAVTSALQPAA
jgi:CheY-like chemotaxis protein